MVFIMNDSEVIGRCLRLLGSDAKEIPEGKTANNEELIDLNQLPPLFLIGWQFTLLLQRRQGKIGL